MDSSRFQYHLELRPAQLRVLSDALLATREQLGPEQDATRAVIDEIIEKLPDPNSMRAVQIEPSPNRDSGSEPPAPPTPLRPIRNDDEDEGPDDDGPGPGPSAA